MIKKEALELALEVGGEDVVADGVADLLKGPEAATVEFVGRGAYGTVVDGLVDIDELALPEAVEDVLADGLWLEVGDAELFAHLALQGLFWGLAVVDMSAYGCIPLAGLNILPRRALLEIDFATRVEHMEMDDGMQQMGTIMANATGG